MWDFTKLRLLLALCQVILSTDNIVTIVNNKLMGVRVIGVPPDDLNLSNKGLESVDQEALSNLTQVKMLNLARNAIKDFPSDVFKNLKTLEYLDLANNRLTSGSFYEGLSSLEVLDLSYNRIEYFGPGYFFGLPNNTNILTAGLKLANISGAMFKNSWGNFRRSQVAIQIAADNPIVYLKSVFNAPYRDNGPAIKVCIDKHHLQSVEDIDEDDLLPEGCRRVGIVSEILNLNGLAIETFEIGWYRVRNKTVSEIFLDENKIAEITKQLLNDLPPDIRRVSLRKNKIQRLERGIIENGNPLELLDFSGNMISYIENGALKKINLVNELYLNNNRLNNTRFMETLPLGIQILSLSQNKIREISPGNFTKFSNFYHLRLDRNYVTELKAKRLNGFSSLWILDLSENRLTKIDPNFFRDLSDLASLDMKENLLKKIDGNWFQETLELGSLSLAGNYITKIQEGATKYLESLSSLDLSDNPIKILENGAFFGLKQTKLTQIKLRNVPVKIIQSGLFEDV